MNKKTIIVLIISTIILVIASVTTIYGEASIEDAYIIDKPNQTKSSPDLSENISENIPSFDPDSNVYLTILVKHISSEDLISVKWKKIENKKERIVQENILDLPKDGSGKIVVSLARKNQKLVPGDYIVEVFLNGKNEISKKFIIREK